MTSPILDRDATDFVLIVDDVPENLAMLHDALDESGYTVFVATNGNAAIQRAQQHLPDIILLDAVMPGMDGFEVCRRLKADFSTEHIPVIFMTGLTEAEHVVAAFDAGGTDYVTKPIRPNEALARISTHLQNSRLMKQARSALDTYGQATIAITPRDGRLIWQTPLARRLLQQYFSMAHEQTPAPLLAWMHETINAKNIGREVFPLVVAQGARRLIFSHIDTSDENEWMLLLREESDTAQIEALMHTFHLTLRESEVLYWLIKGKTNRDIGDILGTSPRTVNKHLEHVFIKLGVETRTAAASLALDKVRAVR